MANGSQGTIPQDLNHHGLKSSGWIFKKNAGPIFFLLRLVLQSKIRTSKIPSFFHEKVIVVKIKQTNSKNFYDFDSHFLSSLFMEPLQLDRSIVMYGH